MGQTYRGHGLYPKRPLAYRSPSQTQPTSGLSRDLRDLLHARIQVPGFQTVNIWNIYNAAGNGLGPQPLHVQNERTTDMQSA